jgi:hypothetical protein
MIHDQYKFGESFLLKYRQPHIERLLLLYILYNYNLYLTNYGQNAYLWTFRSYYDINYQLF